VVLSATDVARCLSAAECREALADAFRRFAAGGADPPRALGFDAQGGGFHLKACLLPGERGRFVAKVNGNFPGNPDRHGLPTIQGVVVLADAADGRPLALLDSASLTAIRTAAASALAAAHLAPAGDGALALIGCGRQGREHLEALLALRDFTEVRLFDPRRDRAEALADLGRRRGPAPCRAVATAAEAARGAGVVVTCTPGSDFVLGAGDVDPGAFVAAVGADYPRKRELHPALVARARVVVDDLDQCATSGDLHHAIAAGLATRESVAADLARVVAGVARVREREDEIVVFDSTGIALEDVAAADRAHCRALELGAGTRVRLAS